jgi:hypothetical protein
MSANPPIVEVAAIPTGPPDGDFILARLGVDPGQGPKQKAVYQILAQEAIEQITSFTSIPCPVATYTGERVPLRDWYDVNLTKWWPLTSLDAVRLFGTTLKIGTEEQLSLGACDCAIDDRKEGIRVRQGIKNTWGGNGGALFVDYKAGFAAYPTDLLEVFFELVMLMFNEKDRVGKSRDRLDKQEIQFIRDLPPAQQATVRRYKRTQVYV